MSELVWSPIRRLDCSVEIGVNYFNNDLNRITFESVSPRRYLELWDKKLLKHFYEDKPKPEHLPTRGQVIKFLQTDGVVLASRTTESMSRPVKKVVPPVKIKPAPQQTKLPITRKTAPQIPAFDVQASSIKLLGLSYRDKEVIEDVLSGRSPYGLTADSLKARLSSICTKLGIPASNRSQTYDRRGALKLVWLRYKQIRRGRW